MKANQRIFAPRGRRSSAFAAQDCRDARTSLRRRPKSEMIALVGTGIRGMSVQDWLGHASVTMTWDVYGHLFPSLEDDHAKLAAGEAAILRS